MDKLFGALCFIACLLIGLFLVGLLDEAIALLVLLLTTDIGG